MTITVDKPILDPCCGSRMFYFDKTDERVLFGDCRRENISLRDKKSKSGLRHLSINPDRIIDFTRLPFSDASFHLVIFDPPHLVRNGRSGWLAKKYGKLGENWRDDIASGFSECFRVLMPNGTLIFKWNEQDIKVSEILKLTDQKPIFGNRCGKTAKSHWLVFMKGPEA